MRKVLFALFLFFPVFFMYSQDVAIGEWKEYLSYKSVVAVAEGDGKVYCATKGGVFFYNKADNSMERLSKINGLSDVEPVVINFNNADKKLLIAYKNSNIDIIEAGYITSISDIKRKQIVGNKSINNVYFINQYAYLACGFGIVVIDMDKVEVKDTYYIGPNGSAINVRDVTHDGTYIYAATDGGVYKAALSNPNLANYANWTKMSGLPNGTYNSIASINGKVIVNYSSTSADKDTVYLYQNNAWSNFFPTPMAITIKSIKVNNNKLTLAFTSSFVGIIAVYDQNLTGINGIYAGYFSDYSRCNTALTDAENTVWIADNKYGLVSYKQSSNTFDSKYPDGPAGTSIFGMSTKDDEILIAPGGKVTFFVDGLYRYKDGAWKNIKGNYPNVVNLDTIFDIVNVYIDPNNSKRAFASTWGFGIIELYNGVPIKVYSKDNSTIQQHNRVQGMVLDEAGTLWLTNWGAAQSVSARTAGGTWTGLNFSPYIGNPNPGEIFIDKNNQKWIIAGPGQGLLVYKGGPGDTPNNTNTKKLSTAAGNGALPSPEVYSIAEDQDGEIWIGSDKGIAVFYSPENVFSNQNFDAQQILIEQDGHVQILLETEQVQTIAVDDANRKWIGTANSGAFLVSADGTQQILHFEENNSPLLSNNVKQIQINRTSGEVYFATDKGLVSYRGTAIEGQENFKDVYAFPNPVKPEYAGPIAIKGLVNNTTIKITDISGSLVYETKSEGGQAIWYGKNFNGQKVSSGVYMVFCTNEDGSQKIATKILFIN